MTKAAEQIIDEIRRLDEEDRSKLAKLIHEEFGPKDPGYEEAWAAEVEQRIDDLDAGRSKLIPAEEVMEKLRKKIEERREKAGSR